mgnify:CR=1 FL=1
MRRILLLALCCLAAHAVEPMLAMGKEHSLYLADDGTVWAWGSNGNGQLGDSTTTNRGTPVQVSGLTSGVTAVVAGYEHACAILQSGVSSCRSQSGFQYRQGGARFELCGPRPVSTRHCRYTCNI